MKLLVRFRHVDPTPVLKLLIPRRIQFALARFAHAIEAVHVTLADVNGPRGGVDKTCRVRVVGAPVGSFVVEASAADARTALDEAAARAGHTLARALQRRRVLMTPA